MLQGPLGLTRTEVEDLVVHDVDLDLRPVALPESPHDLGRRLCVAVVSHDHSVRVHEADEAVRVTCVKLGFHIG